MKNRIEDNLNLVHKLAWKFHISSGVSVEDLISEGYHALCYADSLYDDSRNQAKFTTYAYTAIQSRMVNLIKKESRIGFYEINLLKGSVTLPSQFVDDDYDAEESDIPDPLSMSIESRVSFCQQIESLSSLAQRVCSLVINGVETGNFTRRYDTKTSIKSRLKREGYKKREILSAFTELSEVFG